MSNVSAYSLDLPALLPNETLYSWASRYHRLSGITNAKTTSSILFGNRQAGLRHDFPSGLDHLTKVTRSNLGTAEELIFERTLLPYYLPLVNSQGKAHALRSMHGEHIGSLKYQLGLLTSRFRAHHPLKVCARCYDEDLNNYGVSYWHRSHQWPGVWVCPSHVQPLLTCIEKVNGIQRFQYLLPDEATLVPVVQHLYDKEHEIPLNQLARLAELANAWATDDDFRTVDPANFSHAYRDALRRRGWLTPGGSARIKETAAAYAAHVNPLTRLAEFSALPQGPDQAAAQLTRLLTRPRTGTHPIRHLMIIEWLFGSWSQFRTILTSASETDEPSVSTWTRSQTSEHDLRASQLTHEIRNRGQSISAAAHQLGIDISTAQAVCAQAGIEMRRRPKKLHRIVRDKVLADLATGADKKVVARQHDLSLTTVNRLLKTNPVTDESWRRLRYLTQRRYMREAWKTLLRQHPGLGIKRLRSLSPATHGWLYRNDRAWLKRVNRLVQRVYRGNNSKIDWDTRDRALAARVREAALALHGQYPNRRIQLWHLCGEIPELRARLERSQALPLTTQAIDDALKPAPSSSAKNKNLF